MEDNNDYREYVENNDAVIAKYVGFGEAIRRFFKYYAKPYGRSTRSEYWYVVLFTTILGIIAAYVIKIDAVSTILDIVLLVPNICIQIRRMHDIGKGWAWILITFIPVVGWIWFIVLTVKPSDASNKFGPAPFDDGQPVETYAEEVVEVPSIEEPADPASDIPEEKE